MGTSIASVALCRNKKEATRREKAKGRRCRKEKVWERCCDTFLSTRRLRIQDKTPLLLLAELSVIHVIQIQKHTKEEEKSEEENTRAAEEQDYFPLLSFCSLRSLAL